MTRDAMKATLLQAENIRAGNSELVTRGVYDYRKLSAEAKRSSDIRETALYDTVPVVAAWRSIERTAADEGYDFRVPKFQPRNPKNEPTPEEAAILRQFEGANVTEYFAVDEAHNQIVYARPIRLSADCLICHGSPAASPTRRDRTEDRRHSGRDAGRGAGDQRN
jgi:methyl-accepting chemotaxis protein